MTYEQFLKLPYTQQYLLIKNLAVEVAKRADDYNGFILYQLDSFYIEIRTDRYFDKIEDISFFEQSKRLNSYIGSIDISQII